MKDILKKLAIGIAVYKGLDYAKYRITGGIPLIDKVRNTVMLVKSVFENEKPITLEANDYKIV